MIPVQKQEKPADFDEKVTKRALAFLDRNPNPTKTDIEKKAELWRSVLDDLYEKYREVCAYCGLRFDRDGVSVDHFIPRSAIWKSNPMAAFEWDNFRLASRSMNTEKGDYRDVLDPFTIKPYWFVIHFPSMKVKSGSDLSPGEKAGVEATIARLKLNVGGKRYIDIRRKQVKEYCKWATKWGNIGQALNILERDAPFIAFELKRQGLEEKIVKMLKPRGKTETGSAL